MSKSAQMIKFLECYRENECLWKASSKEYNDKILNEKAMQKMLDIYRVMDPNASIRDVRYKINNMRTAWRREYKKKVASEKSGAGEEEAYLPKLWYYKYLTFLTEADLETKPSAGTLSQDKDDDDLPLMSAPTSEKPVAKKRRDSDVSCEILEKISDRLGRKDRHEYFGGHVTETLNSMTTKQAIYAKGLINQILQMGELQELCAETRIDRFYAYEHLPETEK